MSESMPISSFLKRLNLIIVILTCFGSLAITYIVGSETYSDEVYRVKADDWVDVPLTDEQQMRGPWEKYAVTDNKEKPPFDPDKYLADVKAMDERVAKISALKFYLIGFGFGLLFLASVLFIMATISWLFGYKFKLHISTQ